jgi:hypothetical protein
LLSPKLWIKNDFLLCFMCLCSTPNFLWSIQAWWSTPESAGWCHSSQIVINVTETCTSSRVVFQVASSRTSADCGLQPRAQQVQSKL